MYKLSGENKLKKLHTQKNTSEKVKKSDEADKIKESHKE